MPGDSDYLLRLGQQGTSGGHIMAFVFKLSTDEALTKRLFRNFGIRAQGSGMNGAGSIKLVDFDRVRPSAPAPIPLPAAAPLLLAGLAGLGLVGRRRRH